MKYKYRIRVNVYGVDSQHQSVFYVVQYHWGWLPWWIYLTAWPTSHSTREEALDEIKKHIERQKRETLRAYYYIKIG